MKIPVDDPSRCSTLALNLLRASHQPAGAEVLAHLAKCERCRGYLAMLDAIDGVRPAGRPSNRPSGRPLSTRPHADRRWRWVFPAAGTAAVFAGAVVYFFTAQDAELGPSIPIVGMPSVQMVVRRDRETILWNGTTPVRPRDVLGLRVACEAFSHVTVAVPDAMGGTWTRLKDLDCPTTSSPALPFSLLVDEDPANERFTVILSRAPIGDDALASAASTASRSADVWTVHFDLPKSLELPR